MSSNLLIIFVRNPELGKVKTRLANAIGKEAALDIYLELLQHTYDVVKDCNCDRLVLYSSFIDEEDLWSDDFKKGLQSGADLGVKMHNAFDDAFKSGYEKVVLIGSDLFDIEERHIMNGFDALDHDDYVIGPATDGGYYLIGMKTFNPVPFYNKSWGTASVLRAAMDDLREENVFLLDPLSDIDTIDDLKDHPIYKSWQEKHD